MSDWRNRVVGLEYHAAGDILDHPDQWKIHTPQQSQALLGTLGQVGIADAMIVYHSPAKDGALVRIDGHGRKALDPSAVWPCLVLDVNDAEAALLLASLDPIAALARANAPKLDGLLRKTDTGNAALQGVFAELARQAGLYRQGGSSSPLSAPPATGNFPSSPVEDDGELPEENSWNIWDEDDGEPEGDDAAAYRPGVYQPPSPGVDTSKPFDASKLPDAPNRQLVTPQSYVISVTFSSYEGLVEGVRLLTCGRRRSLPESARFAHIDTERNNEDGQLIALWRKYLGGVNA